MLFLFFFFVHLNLYILEYETEGRKVLVRTVERIFQIYSGLNPLNTKRRLLYLKTQFVPRSKHFSSRL